ncbi:hypothetical protein NQZ68_028520, partial [Dissostichus eleginoides]
IQQQKPGPSCVSMKSDFSMESPLYFKAGQSADGSLRIQQQRPGPGCESMKSDFSMESPMNFKAGQSADE